MRFFAKDIRYGLKLLVKDGGLTTAAVLSLALGIGANTTIFSMANAFLLRPLPVEDPDRLVSLYHTVEGSSSRYGSFSYPEFLDLKERSEVHQGLAAYVWIPLGVRAPGADRAEIILGELVTGEYFDVLGVRPVLGRAFLPEEDRTPGQHPVVVISHDLWKTRFGADPGIIGETVRVNGESYTLIGVAPEGFRGVMVGSTSDAWVPMMMADQVYPGHDSRLEERGAWWLLVIGRLRPDKSLEQARAATAALAVQLGEEFPDSIEGVGISTVPVSRLLMPIGSAIPGLMAILMGVVGLVLLIACSNVANLLLARAATRQREIALRRSLGASRGRITGQLLTESVILAALGGTAGCLLALWAVDILQALELPIPLPVAFDFSLDSRVLAFTTAISVLTGLLFGTAPAWQMSGSDLITSLRDQRGFLGRAVRASRLRLALVVAQVALSLVLLIGAGLLLKGLRSARDIHPGFDDENMLLITLNLSLGRYDEDEGLRFYDELTERVRALPSVQSATVAVNAPPSLIDGLWTNYEIDGYSPPSGGILTASYNMVGPDYFEILGIPLVRGRGIEEQDRHDTQLVTVINETMSERFWPDANPVGRTIKISGTERVIVGVAKDVKYATLGEAPRPFFYLPMRQRYRDKACLHVRTSSDPRKVTEAVLAELHQINADMAVWDIKTMSEHVHGSMFTSRVATSLVGIFGVLAMVLAVVGVHGVIAYTVSRGTHEFGVRMALGARSKQILELVLTEGLKTILIGVGLGLALSLAATRLLTSLLYGVSPLDWTTFATVTIILVLAALAACYGPARRASRIAPSQALRYE
jgi:predicted permease